MVQTILIGIGAGVAAALLFASLASGSLVAILLFYLAPLPILIAGLGWSHWAGLIAAICAAASLAAVFGTFFFLAFLVGIGLPAWWLGYLALLARPAETPPGHLEWYPMGKIVLWAAVIGALIVIASIPYFGTDAESFRATLRNAIESALGVTKPAPGADANANRLIDSDLLAAVAPPMVASLTTIIQVANLWLAARIVKISGRLPRPWPELAAISFPPFTSVLLAAAVAGTFLPGIVAIISGVLAASLMMAYAFLGFAVLHAATRGIQSRPFVLGGVYAAVLIFGWPALILSVLGLADTALDLRGRAARKRGPPQLRP
jgi:magnesium-transporting ATPase (P-type)